MDIWGNKPGTPLAAWSGMTTLARARNKGTHCDNCGGHVNRPPSQCTGKTVCCSVSCAAELRRVRVPTSCVICGAEMEKIPSHVGSVVTCSDACRKLRRAYDVIRNAPRVDPTKETLAQFREARGLSRNQVRYRAAKSVDLDAPLVHECGIRDAESSRSWKSLSACARELGVSVSSVHNAINRNGRVKGVLVVRTTPAMSSRKKP